jgi:hypothetical protein
LTVQTHIQSIADRAILSGNEKISIDTSISNLSSKLNYYFGNNITEQLRFGSSTRGTILPRSMDQRSDIDYMIVFNNTNSKPQTYMNSLRKFANTYYSKSQIAQSSPTIVLKLNHISFDLVPAVADFWFGYNIPAPNKSYEDWISTNPKDFNSTLVSKNKACNFKLKPAIRVLKYWNARAGYVFDSYSLEKWCAEQDFWFCKTIRDYFFSLVSDLSLNWGAAQWRKNKLASAKAIVSKTKEYENSNMALHAELEIIKLLP